MQIDFRKLRRDAGLTQQALAHLVNVTKTTVCRWEKGSRRITAENAVKIDEVSHGKIPKEYLRPDIFGANTAPAAEAFFCPDSNTLNDPKD